MKVHIRELTDDEIKLLVVESKKSFHLTLITKRKWKSFGSIYVLEDKNAFVGVCVVIHLKDIYKLGPVIVLRKYQGKGYGKILLKRVVADFEGKKLYIGSSNPKMSRIISSLGFKKLSSLWKLSLSVKAYLLHYIVESLNPAFVIDFLKKKFSGRPSYIFYMKQ